jgi:hypothetical protein
MRNLLDESSIAQNLDGNRLMGSLRFPAGKLYEPNPAGTSRASWCAVLQPPQAHGVMLSIR